MVNKDQEMHTLRENVQKREEKLLETIKEKETEHD